MRQYGRENTFGPFAYTTRRFLERLDLPESLMYGVMIDAKTFLELDKSPKSVIRELFSRSEGEKFQLVRVAAHFQELDYCQEAIEELGRLGFIVGLNLMQASLRSKGELVKKSKMIAETLPVEVLYFADSLGNMQPCDAVSYTHLTLPTIYSV